MKGMATPAQMAALAAAKGAAFDRLFLDRMIAHHRGAVEMVEALLKQPGAAFDPVLYQFVNDVSNEQQPRSSGWTRCATPSPAIRAST